MHRVSLLLITLENSISGRDITKVKRKQETADLPEYSSAE